MDIVGKSMTKLVSFRIVRGMASMPRQVLSGNLSLAPAAPVSITKVAGKWTVQSSNLRPLVLLFEYMNAKPKHIDKFVEFYNARDFDVLTVNLKPLQLFFPVRGSQVSRYHYVIFLCISDNGRFQSRARFLEVFPLCNIPQFSVLLVFWNFGRKKKFSTDKIRIIVFSW